MAAFLHPEEFNASYFDGKSQTYSHNAGYGEYKRWYRNDSEHFLDKAKKLFDIYDLKGKKTLELGCAKGFVVKDLRDLGVDAYGVDVSSYAISQCEEGMSPYLSVGDIRSCLREYSDQEFDLVYSYRTLECLADEDLALIIPELNRISKQQYHESHKQENLNFYLPRTKDQLLEKGFINTIINII